MPAAAQAALLQTLTVALPKSMARRTRAASVRRCAVNKENTCAFGIRPSRHTMEAGSLNIVANTVCTFASRQCLHFIKDNKFDCLGSFD
jgi:hypothetical protein